MFSLMPKSAAIRLTGFSRFSAGAIASALNFLRVHPPFFVLFSHLYSPLLLYFTLIFVSTRGGKIQTLFARKPVYYNFFVVATHSNRHKTASNCFA
jgi:hypothetical protein